MGAVRWWGRGGGCTCLETNETRLQSLHPGETCVSQQHHRPQAVRPLKSEWCWWRQSPLHHQQIPEGLPERGHQVHLQQLHAVQRVYPGWRHGSGKNCTGTKHVTCKTIFTIIPKVPFLQIFRFSCFYFGCPLQNVEITHSHTLHCRKPLFTLWIICISPCFIKATVLEAQSSLIGQFSQAWVSDCIAVSSQLAHLKAQFLNLLCGFSVLIPLLYLHST